MLGSGNRKPSKIELIIIVIIIAAVVYLAALPIYKWLPGNNTAGTTQLQTSQTSTQDVIPFKYPIKAYYTDKAAGLSMESIQQPGETELSLLDYNNLKLPDSRVFHSEAPKGSPFQRFDITLNEEALNAQQIEIRLEGSSSRLPELYAWNYADSRWTKLKADFGRNSSNLVATASINPSSMVQDKVVRVLAAVAQQNAIIPGDIPEDSDYDFTIVWLTDTQYYSASYPHIYDSMTQYIADVQKQKKIEYVIHTGDIVDDMTIPGQWKNADHSMSILDRAKIPYGVLTGNHDVGFDAEDYSEYFRLFGEKRFADKPTFGGTSNNNRDHFDLVSSNGENFVIIYFGWSVKDQSLEWADSILKKYSDRKAIITVHSYINASGTYRDQGQLIFDRLVKPNANVIMTLNGHYWGTFNRTQQIGNRTVYELFFNVQNGPEGGQGFLRLFHFDTRNKLAYVNTYSPYLNKFNYFEPARDQFLLPLAAEETTVWLATDYVTIDLK